MKRVLALTAVALFGLAPAVGSACEYSDKSAAASAPLERLASASTPAASMAPAQAVAQPLATKAAKSAADKSKPMALERKPAVVPGN